ncbi:MAG: hypothetical protein GYA51_09050 [Candidatus Methanofastidiosa archaeon]|nr:hypothetical protein [Candidatus Methanofastidiosa archaeon]
MTKPQIQQIGEQYSKDDQVDPSGFLRKARWHQSKFRAEVLNLPYNTYGNYLTKKDSESGFNFYNGFGIFEAVKSRYKKYNKPLYSNMLRSEHIPLNFFIPFKNNLEYCKNVFNELFAKNIQTIDQIEIEYAPKPKQKYLNDSTSFDAYIEYTKENSTKGIIGIEVKYTEKEYRITKDSSQWKAVKDPSSLYYTVSERSKLYRPEAFKLLTTDNLRQIWRNHILGESILQVDGDKFNSFSSLTFFPQANAHFIKACKEYMGTLVENRSNFVPITYEYFFHACQKHCPNKEYLGWLNYLIARYIIVDESSN